MTYSTDKATQLNILSEKFHFYNESARSADQELSQAERYGREAEAETKLNLYNFTTAIANQITSEIEKLQA